MKKAIIVIAFFLTGCGAGSQEPQQGTVMPPPVIVHCDVGQPCQH